LKEETSSSREGIEKKVVEIITGALGRKQIKAVKP